MNLIIQKALGAFSGWSSGGPWTSKSVLGAMAVVVAGCGLWFSVLKEGPHRVGTATVTNAPASTDPAGSTEETHWNWRKPFPGYVKWCASYVAGFCIGWFFRKLIQLVAVLAVLVIALLGFGKYVGWDSSHAKERVKTESAWAEHELTAAEDYVFSLLPSAAAGGFGTFRGFRRKTKTGVADPVV